MTIDSDDGFDYEIDHLREADAHTRVTPVTREQHLMRAQAHALIAICVELREMNLALGGDL